MAMRRERGAFLTTMAVLFGVLAVSNFTKALQFLSVNGGIVIFGVKMEGVAANALLGPLMGIVLGTYAIGLWRLAAWVWPLSAVYAFYVPTNLVLFWYRATGPDIPSVGFMLMYLTFALGGSIGTALYLAGHRDKLG